MNNINETVVGDDEYTVILNESSSDSRESLLSSKRSLKGVLHPDKDDLKRDDIVNRQSLNCKLTKFIQFMFAVLLCYLLYSNLALSRRSFL